MPDPSDILAVDSDTALIPTPQVDPVVLLRLVRDNLSELAKWMVWATDGYSIVSAESFIEQSAAAWEAGSGRNYMIENQGRICGNLGLFGLESPARDFELGYWLDSRAQGKGIMTRACDALIREAFTDLGAELVQIKAAPANVKSCGVAVRLQMTEEGTLRRRSRNAHGALLDLLVYSITVEEWMVAQSGK